MANPYNTARRISLESDSDSDMFYNIQIHYDGGRSDIVVDSDISDRHSMVLWLIHNCRGKFEHNYDNYYFELEEDAVAFKLNFA